MRFKLISIPDRIFVEEKVDRRNVNLILQSWIMRLFIIERKINRSIRNHTIPSSKKRHCQERKCDHGYAYPSREHRRAGGKISGGGGGYESWSPLETRRVALFSAICACEMFNAFECSVNSF